MYALSLQITYAFALLMALAFLVYYLPYLLVGFLIVLAVLAVVALVGWFIFKRKYGALLKMSMNPEAFMQQGGPQQNPFSRQQNSGRMGWADSEADAFSEGPAEGPVIQVKAEEIQ